MSWLPIGPDFVLAPRDGNYLRISRRNGFGRQGLVSSIAIDPTDPSTIYVGETPSSGGASAFRSQDDGNSWTPIFDSVHQTNPSESPTAVAINPLNPTTIYLGTFSGNCYVSSTQGDLWGSPVAVGGSIRKIIVDPRTAATPATTVLYAATDNGVFRSADGGSSWSSVLSGNVFSLAASMPPSGTAHFYAGVFQQGIFHTTDPTTPWTNLNTLGIGLPTHTAGTGTEPNGNFDAIAVDFCRQNPDRVYALLAKVQCDAVSCNEVTASFFTTGSPLTSWTQVAATTPPNPGQGLYSFAMAVAPNSPGDGLNDILFFASVGLFRSTDGARTWAGDATGYHADQHSFAFFPDNPPAGAIPAFYVGCDGGIGVSTKFADPTFNIAVAATDFDELRPYSDLGVYQNYNLGKQSSAVYQYAGDPALAALGYIGCQDTGIAAADGALGWRGIMDADGGSLAMVGAADGVKLWAIGGAFEGFPSFRVILFTDRGEFAPASAFTTLGAGGPLIGAPSNYIVGLDQKCLAGGVVRDSDRTLSAPIAATGVQVATPSTMAGIGLGTVLTLDSGLSQENVTVTATTATTFTANFGQTHAAGVTIQLNRSFVVRIGQDGIGSQISQEFGANGVQVNIVAAHPSNADILYCGTTDQRLWTTNSGSTATSSTVWTEVTGTKPSFVNMSSIAIDPAGNVYVLLADPVTVGGGEFTTTSPLFQIVAGNWVVQPSSGLPSGFQFGKLRSDPIQASVQYASNGARVYQLTLASGTWNWVDISDGLPGQWIYDLWVGNIGTDASPKVLLRAAIPTRAMWERDVTAGTRDPIISLYVRDNLLDLGWLPISPDGVPNPYDPGNSAATLFHYMCADIKVDSRQPDQASSPGFFQTDPENSTFPISHVAFDQIKDNSQNLPGNDQALVHVQVHNRSKNKANNVHVWTVFANASAGLPGLNVSPSTSNTFNFWSQFLSSGQIIPNLPADSPWKSMGSPITLTGITAPSPQVATWNWTIPTLASGESGHFCVATFIHSASSPLVETSQNLDEVTPRQRQVGQKNVHIGPPLPPSPSPGGGGTGGGSGVPGPGVMGELIEFHNPTDAVRLASLIFDFSGIAAGITGHIALYQTGYREAVRAIY
ncbi:MAG TPA: hypothetical protein VGZ73_12065 [Bryobacteraceae bacterium]|nr:hypothetical protein [Bryobacteraceae bacterium]